MCINCARRKLEFLSEAFPVEGVKADGSDALWLVCVRDHDAHAHIRVTVDLEEGDEERPDWDEDLASEWVQIATTLETFKQALAETRIRTRFHMHEQDAREDEPTGLSEQLIADLPQFRLDAAEAAAAQKAGDLCPVCYDAFREDELLSQLPCSQKFHSACVGTWLGKATTCPACRAVVTRPALETFLTGLAGAVVTLFPEPEPEQEPAQLTTGDLPDGWTYGGVKEDGKHYYNTPNGPTWSQPMILPAHWVQLVEPATGLC